MLIFSESLSAMHAHVNLHNSNAAESIERLKANHKTCLRSLLAILNEQNLKAKDKTLVLSTNRTHLAAIIGCCTKTAYNLLQRLIKVGAIYKVDHGRKNFEIGFKWPILRIAKPFSHLFEAYSAEINEAKKVMVEAGLADAETVQRQILPQRETGTSINQTKRDVEKPNGFGSCENLTVLEKNGNREECKVRENQPESLNIQPKKSKKIEIDQRRAKKSFRQAQRVWAFAFQTVFLHQNNNLEFVSEHERVVALGALTRIFYHGNEDMRTTYYELMTRFYLVKKYLDKSNKYDKRFVPIPTNYFDPENTKGFAGTKVWFEKHIQQLKKCTKEKRNQFEQERKTQTFISNQMMKFINGGTNMSAYMSGRRSIDKISNGSEQMISLWDNFCYQFVLQ